MQRVFNLKFISSATIKRRFHGLLWSKQTHNSPHIHFLESDFYDPKLWIQKPSIIPDLPDLTRLFKIGKSTIFYCAGMLVWTVDWTVHWMVMLVVTRWYERFSDVWLKVQFSKSKSSPKIYQNVVGKWLNIPWNYHEKYFGTKK